MFFQIRMTIAARWRWLFMFTQATLVNLRRLSETAQDIGTMYGPMKLTAVEQLNWKYPLRPMMVRPHLLQVEMISKKSMSNGLYRSLRLKSSPSHCDLFYRNVFWLWPWRLRLTRTTASSLYEWVCLMGGQCTGELNTDCTLPWCFGGSEETHAISLKWYVVEDYTIPLKL